jgi:hypothetical protein
MKTTIWTMIVGLLSPLLGTPGGHTAHGQAASLQPVAVQAVAMHSHPFFGISVPYADLRLLPAVTKAAGVKPTVFSVFVKLDSSFDASTLTRIHAAGQVPFLTVEPWSWKSLALRPAQRVNERQYSLRNVYRGAFDVSLTKLAQAIAASHVKVYLRFAHEMNAWWYPWSESVNGNSAGDYVQAWRHVHDLLNHTAPGQISWVWSPNAVIEPHASVTPLAKLYPGDAYTDYIGMSCYGHTATAAASCGPTLKQFATLTNKPIILSEIGADGPNKAHWIASLPSLFAATPRIVGFVWFNTTPASAGASGNYEFNQTKASTVAFSSMLRSVGPLAHG